MTKSNPGALKRLKANLAFNEDKGFLALQSGDTDILTLIELVVRAEPWLTEEIKIYEDESDEELEKESNECAESCELDGCSIGHRLAMVLKIRKWLADLATAKGG